MGIFTDMCICPNQQIVSANQNLNVKNDLESNVLMQTVNKDNLEEKNDNKKNNNNNNNEVNNDLIDDNFDERNISDSAVSELILREKLKLIPKEKKLKIKDSNKINIVIIGHKEVGKSSFCIRFVENRFEDFYIPSIGVEKFAKMTAFNSRNFKINFSVICGSDKLKKWINLIEEADFFFFFMTSLKLKVLIT